MILLKVKASERSYDFSQVCSHQGGQEKAAATHTHTRAFTNTHTHLIYHKHAQEWRRTHSDAGAVPGPDPGYCHKHNYSLLVFDPGWISLPSVCKRQNAAEREGEREGTYVDICVRTYYQAGGGRAPFTSRYDSATAVTKTPLNSM